MPITPFHLGPAAAIKAVLPARFSFVAFMLTQFIIDLEPLILMMRGEWPIHRFLHTYVGASVVLVFVVLLGRPLCELALRVWNWLAIKRQHEQHLFKTNISWMAMCLGAAFGCYSHVFLDSFMHADMKPLAPFSDSNILLFVMPIENLHWVCVASGLFGIVVMAIIFTLRDRVAN